MATSKADKGDGGAAEVQKIADEEVEQGFRGVEVDQTPNENYTVEGVLADKPTPESERSNNEAAEDAAGGK